MVRTKLNLVFVTPQLICAFVFAYAKSWFSHDAAQLMHEQSCKILCLIVLGQ